MKADPQAEIRAAFKERRLRLGMRQKDMARELGISRLKYARIETSSRISPELRVQIATALSKLEDEMRQQTK